MARLIKEIDPEPKKIKHHLKKKDIGPDTLIFCFIFGLVVGFCLGYITFGYIQW